jgi:hypothetical protein
VLPLVHFIWVGSILGCSVSETKMRPDPKVKSSGPSAAEGDEWDEAAAAVEAEVRLSPK